MGTHLSPIWVELEVVYCSFRALTMVEVKWLLEEDLTLLLWLTTFIRDLGI